MSPFWNMMAELGFWCIAGLMGAYVVIELVLWVRRFFRP